MPVRLLSDAELARLSTWPDEIAGDDLVPYFTLSSDAVGRLASTIRVENRPGAGDRKHLEALLLARGLTPGTEHDAPGGLLQLACDWPRNERIVRRVGAVGCWRAARR